MRSIRRDQQVNRRGQARRELTRRLQMLAKWKKKLKAALHVKRKGQAAPPDACPADLPTSTTTTASTAAARVCGPSGLAAPSPQPEQPNETDKRARQPCASRQQAHAAAERVGNAGHCHVSKSTDDFITTLQLRRLSVRVGDDEATLARQGAVPRERHSDVSDATFYSCDGSHEYFSDDSSPGADVFRQRRRSRLSHGPLLTGTTEASSQDHLWPGWSEHLHTSSVVLSSVGDAGSINAGVQQVRTDALASPLHATGGIPSTAAESPRVASGLCDMRAERVTSGQTASARAFATMGSLSVEESIISSFERRWSGRTEPAAVVDAAKKATTDTLGPSHDGLDMPDAAWHAALSVWRAEHASRASHAQDAVASADVDVDELLVGIFVQSNGQYCDGCQHGALACIVRIDQLWRCGSHRLRLHW